MLCSGVSRSNILRVLSEEWQCSERNVEIYLSRARKQLEADCEVSRPAFLAECLAGIREVRENATKRGQHQVALNAIRLQAELTGLNKST